MPFASTNVENKILDHYVGKTSWTFVSSTGLYVGLSTTTPTKTGTNVTEPSSGAYARVNITAAQFTAASGGASENNTDKAFPQATADWASGANFTHVVFYDASSAGNFLGFSALATPRAVLSGDTAKILSGEFDLAFS